MKKLLLFILAITVFSGVVSNAQQDVTGTWQGVLQAGRDLRTVIKITKADAELKAVLYSIDQGGTLPASGVTLTGSVLRFAIPGVGATYEGRVSADGTSIAGTMTQGDKPFAAEPDARNSRHGMGHSGTGGTSQANGRRCQPVV